MNLKLRTEEMTRGGCVLYSDVAQEVRVDGDAASNHPPNSFLGKRYCEQCPCPWLDQVRQTAEKRDFRSRQRRELCLGTSNSLEQQSKREFSRVCDISP